MTRNADTCPFTLTIATTPGRPSERRVIVSVPDPGDGRDFGGTDWPSDERIEAEASKQVGHPVKLVGCGDACEQGEWTQAIEDVPAEE